MKTRQEIEVRLSGFRKKYRAVSSDNIDPELEASIRELKWVLRDSETKEIEENCLYCKYCTCPVDEYPCIRCDSFSQWERNESYISHDG